MPVKAKKTASSKVVHSKTGKLSERSYLLARGQKIEIPANKLEQVFKVLKLDAKKLKGDVVEEQTAPDMTTQEVADLLNVSRPFVVKLIEDGKLPSYKVGTHRRVAKSVAVAYKAKMLSQQRKALDSLTEESEDLDLDF